MIVKKTASAYASGDSPAAADGLGHAPYGMGTSRFSAGSAYEVKKGASFEVKVQPSASVSGPQGGTCGVSVIVSCTLVRIGLSNVTKTPSGQDECLIGQGQYGTISAQGYTFDSHQWSVGGSKFKSYDISSDERQGTLSPHHATDWGAVSPHWFWNEPGNVTVTCTARAKQGNIVVGTVTVTRDVTVSRPYRAFTANKSSQLYFAGNAVYSGSGVPDLVTSVDPSTPSTDPLYTNGIVFFGEVGTQDRFRRASGTNRKGLHCYVQLCDLDSLLWSALNPIPTPYSTQGRWDLDNHFPYSYGGGPYQADSVEPPGTPLPNQVTAEDAPSLGINPGYNRFKFDDRYDMTQMYLPPGEDSAWVPLNHISWDCYGEGYSPWPPTGSPVSGSYVLEGAKGSGPTTQHPVWTNRFVNVGK